jgi:hypothetical protein
MLHDLYSQNSFHIVSYSQALPNSSLACWISDQSHWRISQPTEYHVMLEKYACQDVELHKPTPGEIATFKSAQRPFLVLISTLAIEYLDLYA